MTLNAQKFRVNKYNKNAIQSQNSSNHSEVYKDCKQQIRSIIIVNGHIAIFINERYFMSIQSALNMVIQPRSYQVVPVMYLKRIF